MQTMQDNHMDRITSKVQIPRRLLRNLKFPIVSSLNDGKTIQIKDSQKIRDPCASFAVDCTRVVRHPKHALYVRETHLRNLPKHLAVHTQLANLENRIPMLTLHLLHPPLPLLSLDLDSHRLRLGPQHRSPAGEQSLVEIRRRSSMRPAARWVYFGQLRIVGEADERLRSRRRRRLRPFGSGLSAAHCELAAAERGSAGQAQDIARSHAVHEEREAESVTGGDEVRFAVEVDCSIKGRLEGEARQPGAEVGGEVEGF